VMVDEAVVTMERQGLVNCSGRERNEEMKLQRKRR